MPISLLNGVFLILSSVPNFETSSERGITKGREEGSCGVLRGVMSTPKVFWPQSRLFGPSGSEIGHNSAFIAINITNQEHEGVKCSKPC
mmetsp:Transcript_4861/g.10243  ORF Transcript_4861/g.10243 Transcript_4861/m.10243 type:complete len:89 (-) Transcript_4861:533-799(-)